MPSLPSQHYTTIQSALDTSSPTALAGGEGFGMKAGEVKRKPGRPRAVPESMIPDVLRLYSEGLGYRAIARELAKQGVSVDWSTVRRVIKAVRSGGQQQK